jgi:catechol 2,3-dioxygenase
MPRAPARRTIGAMTNIDPGVSIGHVHINVSDLDRSLAFYRDALGFHVQGRFGDQMAFLAAGDYHHHLGLSAGTTPEPGATGLNHTALRYPTRDALIAAARRILDCGYAIDHGSDHGVNECVFLHDPDGNGVEMYWDRPMAEWPRKPDGGLAMIRLPLDVDALLSS